MAKKTLRKSNAKDSWPEKGQTTDRGIGSRARSMLSEHGNGESLRSAYNKVVKAVEGLDEPEQRIVCLMAGSDYTFESLIAKATSAGGGKPKMSETDKRRLKAIKDKFGAAGAKQFEEMLLFGKSNAEKS